MNFKKKEKQPFLFGLKLALCVLVLLTVVPVSSAEDVETGFLKVFHSISSHELYDYMCKLTSDEWKGRLSGAPGYIQCAQWVASKLESWGVKPLGDDGTYFQWFDKPYTDVRSLGSLELLIPGPGGSTLVKKYAFPEHYFPGSNSGSGKVKAPVIYVGHGISAPEINYDDYKGIDVKGKIVLVESGIPSSSKDKDYASWIPHSTSPGKLKNALKHGAVGMIYVGKIANPNTVYQKELVYCHIGKEVVEDFFFGTGKNHTEIKAAIKKTKKPASFDTGKEAVITADTVYHPEGKGCNVIGVIEGVDPLLKSEVILVGGHLDAVGYYGDVVLPGAWDNGSGIVNMMAALRALAQSPVKLKRSVAFIFIGGEESNFSGSKLFCRRPAFPKSKTVCYFNLDMVGRGTGLRVGGGLSYPLILGCFKRANDKYIHRPFKSSKTWKTGIGRPRSDSQIFKRAGYRTLSVGAFGPHDKKNYYHHPYDTKETLNYEIMEDVAKLIYTGITDMSNADKLFDPAE